MVNEPYRYTWTNHLRVGEEIFKIFFQIDTGDVNKQWYREKKRILKHVLNYH